MQDSVDVQQPLLDEQRFEQVVEQKIDALLKEIGEPFVSQRQVKVSALHWPDVVWFDKALPKIFSRSDIAGEGRVPIIGFEIESSASMQSIKAAINNLEALKPALGCIVIPTSVAAKKRAPNRNAQVYGKTAREVVEYLAKRSWLPIIVLTEDELISDAEAKIRQERETWKGIRAVARGLVEPSR